MTTGIPSLRSQIHSLIHLERERQVKEFGSQDDQWSHAEWLVILGEEFGEVSREIRDRLRKPLPAESRVRLIQELVQTAAVCLAWLEECPEFCSFDFEQCLIDARA